jgi:guanylate kinase
MISRGVKFGISTTTRAPRKGEVDGKDYHFVSNEDFMSKVENGEMVMYQFFNGNYYGITKKHFDECEAMILNVKVVNDLPEDVRASMFIIYINIDIKTRMQRMKERDVDVKDIAQRVYEDDREYDGFTNYDLIITNPNF